MRGRLLGGSKAAFFFVSSAVFRYFSFQNAILEATEGVPHGFRAVKRLYFDTCGTFWCSFPGGCAAFLLVSTASAFFRSKTRSSTLWRGFMCSFRGFESACFESLRNAFLQVSRSMSWWKRFGAAFCLPKESEGPKRSKKASAIQENGFRGSYNANRGYSRCYGRDYFSISSLQKHGLFLVWTAQPSWPPRKSRAEEDKDGGRGIHSPLCRRGARRNARSV